MWQNTPASIELLGARMYVYEVSALGLAGEIVRPIHLLVQDQAAAVLPHIGGYETAAVENFKLNGLVFAKSVRSTVAGSYDEKRDSQSALASAVIEDLNICYIVTADRVVARLSASRAGSGEETQYGLSGTRFDNLRIGGRPVEASLDIDAFNQVSTYSRLEKAYSSREWLEYIHGSQLGPKNDAHPSLDALYWEQHKANRPGALPSWYTLANHVRVEASGFRTFGSIIIVPDFGVIHLAEVFITQRQRRLSMLRLELGSPIEGKLVAATCSVGDTTDSTGPR
jgi:hypothetical protein